MLASSVLVEDTLRLGRVQLQCVIGFFTVQRQALGLQSDEPDRRGSRAPLGLRPLSSTPHGAARHATT